MNPQEVFTIRTKSEFRKKALQIFRLQAESNSIYKKYIGQLRVDPERVKSIEQIPFLPIEFFKTQKVITIMDRETGIRRNSKSSQLPTPSSRLFLSSGTTGMERSKHYVADISLYEKSFRKGFEFFYGDIKQYAVFAFLPSYYENKNASLIYMANDLIANSRNGHSRFYADSEEVMAWLTLREHFSKKRKTSRQKNILLGVTHALLELARADGRKYNFKNTIIIETGGMKGRGEEITREELHKTLCEKFGVKKIHSEYGMTELLSQAYSKGEGIFKSPPWMKVLVRDPNDPFSFLPPGRTGALDIIDLANIYSCSFIATQDIGKVHQNNSFEVLGRMDNSDLRGCNLLAG